MSGAECGKAELETITFYQISIQQHRLQVVAYTYHNQVAASLYML